MSTLTTTTPTTPAEGLAQHSPKMQRHVDRTLAADRKGGEALWEKACAVADARADAEHGDWGRYLTATGQDERAARRLIDIAERGRADARFRDAIIGGWLTFSVAAIVAHAEQALLDHLLAAPTPPSRRQVEALANPAPVPDLKPAPSVLPSLRSALIRLDAHTAQPLLYGIPPGKLRNEWRDDIELIREIADCVHRLDGDGAHRVAQRLADRELRETMLRAYPAQQPAPEAEAAPAVSDPFAPIRSAVLAGPNRWPAARKLIAELDEPARTAWGNDLLAVQSIDQDLRKGQIGRLDKLIGALADPALAEHQQAITAGACRELGLAWPKPEPAGVAPILEQLLAADDASAEDLDEARALIRQLPPAEQAAPLTRLMERGATLASAAAPAGVIVTVASADPASDRWQLDGPAGPEGYRGGQLGTLLRRLAHIAQAAAAPADNRGIAPHAPADKVPADWDHWRDYAKAAGGDLALSQAGIVTWVQGGRVAGRAKAQDAGQWAALCEKIADALPEPAEVPEPRPTPLPEGEIVSDWAIVEDDEGNEVVLIDALGMPSEAGEAIAAVAAALRLLALGQAHAVDTPALDQLMGEVQHAPGISPAAAATLISVLELIAQDADRAAEQQARAA